MSYKRNRIDGYNKSLIKYDSNRALLNNETNSVSDQNYKDLLDRYGLVTQQLTQVQQQLIAVNTALGLSGSSVNFANQASLNLGNRFKVNCSTNGQSVNFGNTSDPSDITDNQLVFAPGNTAPNSINGVAKLTKKGVILNDKTLFFRSSGGATFQASDADPNHTIKYGASNDGLEINSYNTTMFKRNGVDKFSINENNVVSAVDILTDGKVKAGTGGLRLNRFGTKPDNNKGNNESIDFGEDVGLITRETLPDVISSNGRSILSLAAYEGVSLGYRDTSVNNYDFNRLLQADRWGVKAYRQFRAPNTFQTGVWTADKTYEKDEVLITFPETMASTPAVFLSFDLNGVTVNGSQIVAAGDDNPAGYDTFGPFIHHVLHNVYQVSTSGFKCTYMVCRANFGSNSGGYWALARDDGATNGANKNSYNMLIDGSKEVNMRWFAICS
jgi:hypothetical protein